MVDRNRLAMFAAMFLARGIGFTVTVLLAMYVQNIMGYSPLRAAVGFIPFAVAMAFATAVSSRLVMWFSPRVMVIAGGMGAVLNLCNCTQVLRRRTRQSAEAP